MAERKLKRGKSDPEQRDPGRLEYDHHREERHRSDAASQAELLRRSRADRSRSDANDTAGPAGERESAVDAGEPPLGLRIFFGQSQKPSRGTT
jgi:hypothetical protein